MGFPTGKSSATCASPYLSTSSQDHGSNRRTLDRRYSRIADSYNSLDEVTEALANAGLESSNLIVGIDFTKSNEWTGKRSFNRKSLHHIGDGLNPYEQAISIIGKTLAAFDDDNLIPCYGFGDDVFSFYPDERFCNGFEEVLSRYREIVPHTRLAGPTSFAPIIEMAIQLSSKAVITNTQSGRLSPQEQETLDAIVQASKLPLSIILVGVGDEPWHMMKEVEDNIPARAFDNLQFVNFMGIMSKKTPPSRKETEFALAALMEIPTQYKATTELNILGRPNGNIPQRVARHPSTHDAASVNSLIPFHFPGFQLTVPPYADSSESSDSSERSFTNSQLCTICLINSKVMAFGCGHMTCEDCAKDLQICPICRSPITTKIKLYF